MKSSKLTFRKNLNRLLDERSLRASDICRKSGILPQNFSKYITGKLTPSLDSIDKIARAFNVDTATFLMDCRPSIGVSRKRITDAIDEAIGKMYSFSGIPDSETGKFLEKVEKLGGWKGVHKLITEEIKLREIGEEIYRNKKKHIYAELKLLKKSRDKRKRA